MRRRRVWIFAGIVAVFAMGSARAPEPGGVTEQSESTCCFTHPSHTGTCSVQPAEDETCADILAYLNNPMAQGKNYCGGTKIRAAGSESRASRELARILTARSSLATQHVDWIRARRTPSGHVRREHSRKRNDEGGRDERREVRGLDFEEKRREQPRR